MKKRPFVKSSARTRLISTLSLCPQPSVSDTESTPTSPPSHKVNQSCSFWQVGWQTAGQERRQQAGGQCWKTTSGATRDVCPRLVWCWARVAQHQTSLGLTSSVAGLQSIRREGCRWRRSSTGKRGEEDSNIWGRGPLLQIATRWIAIGANWQTLRIYQAWRFSGRSSGSTHLVRSAKPKAVAAHLEMKQLLPFGFASIGTDGRLTLVGTDSAHLLRVSS